MKRHLCHWLQHSALAVERRHWLGRAIMTVTAVAVATAAQTQLLSGHYLLFHPAIVWATWYGGLRMGIFGTLLSVIAVHFAFEPVNGPEAWPGQWWSLLIFMPVSLFLAFLTNLLQLAMVELKEAWDKAIKGKETLDHVYAGISDAFFCVDHEWRFVIANRKAMEMKPPGDQDLVGRNLWESCGDRITSEGKQRLRTVMRDRVAVSFEHHLPDTECWQEVHVYPWERGLSIFLTDISDRKKLEQRLEAAHEQLRKYAGELEERVKNRTERLKEMAAELETFSYSVSHDLRSPLRSMQAYAQTILDQSGRQLEPTARHYLEGIERSARRLDQLIQDVLTFEQLAGARFTIEKVDLNELVPDMIHQYPRLARNQDLIQIAAPLLPVKGNTACLAQCLANLLDNALKFAAPARSPLVRVSTFAAGNHVHLAIEETGVEIAPHRLAHIFDVFQRDHTGFETAGIGLALARKSAERMGGQITVESEEGKGTRFILVLEAA